MLAGSYVLIWLALWYAAETADVLGGTSPWFLPAGLRFFAFLLFGWPAFLLELVVVLIANTTQFMFSGLSTAGFLTAQMGWLVYDWCAVPLAYAVVFFPVRWRMRNGLDLALTKHSALFIGVAMVAPIFGAMTGTNRLVYASIIEPSQWTTATVSWFTGDFISIITLAPLLLVRGWPHLARYFPQGHLRSLPSALAVALCGAADRRWWLLVITV